MTDPIRVAHVVLQLETGGMERLLTEFARHADRDRFSLRFVSMGSRGRLADEIESCGWPVTALDAPPGVRPLVIQQMARLFRDHGVDIVHTHNTKPLLYAGPAARLAGVRGVIHTRHGQRRGATRVQNGLFRLAARCADRVVCVSSDAAALCEQEGISRGRVHTILNGIDTQKFAFGGPAERGPIVFLGRLSPEKDVATLLRAARAVVERVPGFVLEIGGEGPCAGDLKQLAADLGIAGHVQFLSEVTDVQALLRRASLLVLPSLSEGLPVTVLEAMACGLPVVATAVGGTPEAVADGQTGLLVRPGDPAQLAEAMIRVWRDAELARRMGAAGRRRTETYFDVRAMVARYESVYREVTAAEAGIAA
jgi:glycosyltransferase involved in cell wall biosynthesis